MQIDIFTPVLLRAQFPWAERGKQLKYPSTDESVHPMEYYSAIEREAVTHTSMWTCLENSMPSESSQTQKSTQSVIPSTWNEENRQKHRGGKQAGGCQGLRAEDGSGCSRGQVSTWGGEGLGSHGGCGCTKLFFSLSLFPLDPCSLC